MTKQNKWFLNLILIINLVSIPGTQGLYRGGFLDKFNYTVKAEPKHFLQITIQCKKKVKKM